MSEATGGKRRRGVDSYGIMRSMNPEGRRLLAEAVERHRNFRGWSRKTMAIEAAGDMTGPPISDSTIKNVENRESHSEITGRTAAAIERAFDWPPGTVAGILAGEAAPDPGADVTQETPTQENERAWATFQSWPKDVQDAAVYFGSILAAHQDAKRRQELSERAFGLLLRSPL